MVPLDKMHLFYLDWYVLIVPLKYFTNCQVKKLLFATIIYIFISAKFGTATSQPGLPYRIE